MAINNRQVFENILLVAGGGGGTHGYDDQDCDDCDTSLDTSANREYCADGGKDGAPDKDAYFLGPSWAMVGLVSNRVLVQQEVLLKVVIVVIVEALEVEGVLECMEEKEDSLEVVVDEVIGMVAVMSDQMEKMSLKRLEILPMVKLR